MTNNADPDQLASSKANWSGWIYTVCKGKAYPGQAGQVLCPSKFSQNQCNQKNFVFPYRAQLFKASLA